MNEFLKIDFGEISSEAERENNPNLLKDGFIDLNSVEQEALGGRRFLFLGYKGTGKSAIGERIDLMQGGKYDRFVRKVSLSDFPFTPFSKIIKGDIEPEAKFPTAWSWIILIYVLASFGRDAAATHPDILQLGMVLKAFEEMGLSPEASPASIVRTASKKSFSINMPYNLLSYKSDDGQVKNVGDIFNFVDAMKHFIGSISSPNFHYLIIDGLDDILSSRSIQYKSLYALISEASSLNGAFFKSSVPFKVIVLCRSDLFEKTPGPNKNKIKQAYGVELNWYHDPNEPNNSMLIRGANLRAEISLGRQVDIFREFFPNKVYDTPVKQYFLDLTRHTPRDFFQLLTYIKKYYTNEKISEDNLKSAFRDYSINYFLPEVHDELSGYAEMDDINSIFLAFDFVGKRDFSYDELLSAWTDVGVGRTEEGLISICNALFDCGAIGHIYEAKTTHYSFKYRNKLSSFHKSKRIMLHQGLWKAVNVRS